MTKWNIAFWEYTFLAPHWLWLLALSPLLLWFLVFLQGKSSGELKFAGKEETQASLGENWVKYLLWLRSLLFCLVYIFGVFALAKPTHWTGYDEYKQNYKNGIDIVLAMDISVSMLARDFDPNRLEAAKRVAKEFIEGRNGDRIGLVAYEGEAFTACPATTDYTILKSQIDDLEPGNLEPGTAIGIGLGTAVTRLRNDSLPSKVIILLTDGINNVGDITPIQAAELAKAKNIRVYTIGVGSLGMAPSPVFTPFGMEYQEAPVEIDEITLTKIAQLTDGKYFRAKDEQSLRAIYKEIEQLEKRKIKDLDYQSEPPVFPTPFLNWAIFCLVLALAIQFLFFKSYE